VAYPTTPFFKYLSVQPTWRQFIEDLVNAEAELLKKDLPINREVPATSSQGFLS